MNFYKSRDILDLNELNNAKIKFFSSSENARNSIRQVKYTNDPEITIKMISNMLFIENSLIKLYVKALAKTIFARKTWLIT